METRIRVAVVFGGRSAEHDVSLMSARSIVQVIDKSKYDLVLVGIDREGRWLLNEAAIPLLEGGGDPTEVLRSSEGVSLASDLVEVALVSESGKAQLLDLNGRRSLGPVGVVFPVLHGPYGEDGSLQGLCRMANVACVGAGVLGSAIGMDKDVTKRLLRDAGIPTARFLVARRDGGAVLDFDIAAGELGTPLFVKPTSMGSSIGISKVRNDREFDEALELAFQFGEKVIVEEAIGGREIECSVLGNEVPMASMPGEIVFARDYYDYRSKYFDDDATSLEIPAKLDDETVEKVRTTAVRAYVALCCEGMARVDTFLTPDGRVLVNELNTIPGFTRSSMYARMWEASGVPYRELIGRLIALALERHAETERVRTSP